MGFILNAEAVAADAMRSIDSTLADKYARLIGFLALHPGYASKMKGKSASPVGSEAYIRSRAQAFASSRAPKAPALPTTIPDELVSFILHEYFAVPSENLERAQREHLRSMGAENLVGELLGIPRAIVTRHVSLEWPPPRKSRH